MPVNSGTLVLAGDIKDPLKSPIYGCVILTFGTLTSVSVPLKEELSVDETPVCEASGIVIETPVTEMVWQVTAPVVKLNVLLFAPAPQGP